MHVKNGPDTYSVDEIDLYVGGHKIEPYAGPVSMSAPPAAKLAAHDVRTITDAEARSLGLAADEAAKVHIDELMALLGADLCAAIGERSSKLPKHIQMIAARVALEQGLDPVQCLNDLDATLERMGTDKAFGDSIRALGARMGAPKVGQVVDLIPRRPEPNRHARRAAKAQARGRK